MAARAIWKGVIRFGDASVPVKLYSAVEDRTVHFRLLHEKDHVPVQQRMVHARTGEPVAREDVRRGYETEDGSFVILTEEELEALEPEASRDIHITHFVQPGTIRQPWYERPYWLGPDGSADDYFALAEALEEQNREGFARWVMRKKNYIGSLRAQDGRLALVTLRSAAEVVSLGAFGAPSGRDLDKREVQLAEQLVSALEDVFDAEEYEDEYRLRVMELIEAKAEGKTIRFPKRKPEAPEESISAALEKSVEAAKKRKTA